MDILSNPFILALFALLAIPGVTSALAGLLKTAKDATGIPSKVFVYVASLLITLGILLLARDGLPAWTGDPAAFVTLWLGYLVANAEVARRLYEAINERLLI